MSSRTIDYILKVSTKNATASLKRVSAQAGTLGQRLGATSRKMGKSFAAIGAGALAAAGTIIFFGQKVANLANNLTDTAAKTGLTTKTIAGLKFAAEGSGLQLQSLTAGLVRFQTSMAMAADGNNLASEAFERLGVKATDANGNLRSANDVFMEVTNALGEMQNATERNTVAIDIFGARAGPALIQSGALGNMKAFADVASTFGVNMEEAGAEAGAFQRAMAEIKLVLEGTFAGLLTAATGTTKLSDGLFVVVDNIVFFGTIAKHTLKNVRNMVHALVLIFVNLKDAIMGVGGILFSVFTRDFKKAEEIASETMKKMAGNMQAVGEALTDGMKSTGAIQRAAEKAVADLQEFRGKLNTSMERTGAGGGSGVAGRAAAAAAPIGPGMFGGLGDIMKNSSKDFAEFSGQVKNAAEIIETLPRELNATFALLPGLIGASTVIGAASGPEAAIRAIGDGLSTLTLGLSEIFSDMIIGLARLGEKSPEELQKETEAFLQGLEKGFEALPAILIKVLPRFVIGLSIAIIKGILKLPALFAEAIFEALSDLFANLKQFLREIFTREGRQEKRQRAKDAGELTNFQKFLVLAGGGSSSEFMSGGIMQAQAGMRFTGAKRGLAMLHEGEAVVPASGRAGQAEQRMMGAGGGGVNIVINSAVVENRAIDELVRKLENRFGQFGVGKSTLFGR
jgi:hypothetical protein